MAKKGVTHMNAVELLMKLDKGTLATIPTKEVEIKRLSSKVGAPFIVKLKAISGEKFNAIASRIDRENDAANYTSSKHLLLESMVEPDLRDHALQEHFGAATPLDLMEKIFLAGEIMQLASDVTDLSGFGGNIEAEIKN